MGESRIKILPSMKNFRIHFQLNAKKLLLICLIIQIIAVLLQGAIIVGSAPFTFVLLTCWIGTIVGIVGLLIPFFSSLPWRFKLLNIIPAVFFITGWGSWLWIHYKNVLSAINIWGLTPVIGVVALGIILSFISVLPE